MFTQTPLKRVLFSRTLALAVVGVLSVVSILAADLLGGLRFTSDKVLAATNSTVNFQARLQTARGSIVPDGNYNVQFKLYSVSTGGSALWTETYQNSNSQGIRVANGYLTTSLGSITAFPSTINWDQDLWVTMNIGGTSTSASVTWDGEMNPRLHLTAVPYALRAGSLATYNNTTGYTSTLNILQPTGGNQVFQLADQGAGGTYTICVQNGSCSPGAGSANYIQNQNSSQQTSSNFWLSGTGRADTALQAPSFDTPTAVALNIGTTNATSITVGKTGVNTVIGGNLSVGTTQSLGAITIANGAWFTAVDSTGSGTVNMFQVNSNNQIQVGAALNVDGGIVLPTNGGQLTFSDLPIDSTATAGTKEGYTLRVGSSNALTVYGEADGAGNAQNVRVAVGSSITPQYMLDVGGDINTSTGYRVGGTAGTSTTCSGGQVLQNQVVNGGIVTGGSCVSAASSVSGSFVSLQATTPGTADTGNFNINGTGIAATFQAATFQNAGTLTIAATGANQINLSTNGSTRWSVLSTGELQGNGASTLESSTGNLTLKSMAGNGSIVLTPNGTGVVNISSGTLQISGNNFVNSSRTIQSGTTWNGNAIGVAYGGTGATTLTAGGILFGNGTSAIANSGVLTNGQLLIGDGSGAPTVGTLAGTGGITITNGAGTITVGTDTTICTTAGNCAGAGGDITGSGTANTIAMFTSTGGIGNSILTQSGSTIGLTGTLQATTVDANSLLTNGTTRIDSSGNLTNINNATIGGTVTVNDFNSVKASLPANTVVSQDPTSLAQGPMAGTEWHDLFAFDKYATPTYEQYNGTAWNAATLNNNLFAEKQNQAISIFDGSTTTAARWTWNSNSFAWSTGEWINIGFTYTNPAATKTIQFESSADGTTWTTRHISTGNTQNSAPGWFYVSSYGGDTYLRLTITGTSSGSVNLSSIKLLTSRWGDQGGGSELSLPYSWDGSQNMTTGAALTTNGNLTVNGSGYLAVGGQQVITSAGVLQNVTANANILTSGTIGASLLSGSYTGITGVGTLTTGTWNGTVIGNAYGGTGLNTSTAANGQLLIGNGSGFTLGTITAGTGISITNTAGAITITGSGAAGSAGGDLSGSYPSPTIAKLQGSTLTLTTPASGNILQFNGTAWVNQAVSGDVTISSTGVASIGTGKVTSADILDGTVTGTDIANNTITNSDIASGAYGNITGTGALASGSIASGFGTISTANNITTTQTVQGGTINATSALQTGGTTRIDASGNLTNIANITSSGSMVATAVNAKGYTTSNTSSTYNGQWTRLGLCTLTAQYQACRSQATVVSTSDGGSLTRALLDIRVKQQSAMGAAPYVNFDLIDAQGVSQLNFEAVTTVNTTGQTTVELWAQINPTYQSWSISPLVNTDSVQFTWQANQGFQTAVPAGAVTNANYGPTNTSSVTINDTQVITSARVLQNVTASAGILTSGTVASSLLTGGYTGITSVGTLTGLTVSGVITSTVATGTAPLTVASTTKVTNLNADLLDGLDSTAFAASSGSANYIQNQNASTQTANFKINGTGVAGTLQAGTFDTASAAGLNIGSTNANAINLGKSSGSVNLQTTIYGTALFKTNSDSTSSFQITDHLSNSILTVDTVDLNVGIGLQGAASDARLYSYVQSGTNAVIRGNTGGTGDLLQLQQSGTNVMDVSSTGSMLLKNSTNSTTVMQIQNTAGASFFTADSTNQVITTKELNVGSLANSLGSRLFSDGFEGGNFKAWANNSQPVASGSSSVTVNTSIVHNGHYAMKVVASSGKSYASTYFQKGVNVNARAYVYLASASQNVRLIYLGDDSDNQYVSLNYDQATGKMSVYNGNTSTSTDTSATLTLNAWHEIELDTTANATTGTITAYFDGNSVFSQTNVNTGATPFYFMAGDDATNRTFTAYFDDIAVDAVRPGDSSSLNVNDSLHVAGSSSFNGNMVVQTNSNSYNAFRVQDANGTGYLSVDTNGGAVHIDPDGKNYGTLYGSLMFGGTGSTEGIGSDRSGSTSNPYGLDFYTNSSAALSLYNNGSAQFNVGYQGTVTMSGNSTSTTTPIARILQGGSGDATMEFKNSTLNQSFFTGVQGSTGNFVINSSTAATTQTSSGSPAHVQSAGNGSDSTQATTISTTLGTSVTVGNTIIVTASWDVAGGNGYTCSDNHGNTYTNVTMNTDTPNGQNTAVCYTHVTTGGSTTVTVTFASATGYRKIIASEFSNIASANPVDVYTSNLGAGTTATDGISSGAATTTQSGDLIYGGVIETTTGSPNLTAGTGYTLGTYNATSGGVGGADEYKIQSSAGSVAATMTEGVSGNWQAIMVAFKPQITTTSTPAHVQSNSTATTSANPSNTISLAFSSNVTAGDTIIASTVWSQTSGGSVTGYTCSDSSNNTYTNVTQVADNSKSQYGAVCYARATTGGATTVTVTFTGTASQNLYRTLTIGEYSNVAASSPVDGFASNVAVATTATDNATSGSVTTTQNGDLIYGATIDDGNNCGTMSAGTGFTQRAYSSAGDCTAAQDKVQSAAGSVASTMTFGTGSENYIAFVVAFKAAPLTKTDSNNFANPILSLSQSGAATFMNSINSSTAFRVQNAVGTSLFAVDTNGSHVCINASSCTHTLGVQGTIAASGAITASTTPDLSETIAAAPDVMAADVVMADPNNTERVVKASGAYNGAAVGVISDGTSSFMINAYGGSSSELTGKPLVLAGRVPVKISGENGAIKPGDYLTTSATLPGYAMKATVAGATIGKALGFFDPAVSGATGTVLALVNVSYHDPNAGEAALQGGDASFTSLNISGASTLAALTVTGSATFQADLTVKGLLTVQTIVVNGHIVTSGNAPTVTVGSAAGQPTITNGITDASTVPTVTVDGNDSAGTITITTGSNSVASGAMAHVTFAQNFSGGYKIVVSASNDAASDLHTYTAKTNGGFDLDTASTPSAQTQYQFDYIILGTQAAAQ